MTTHIEQQQHTQWAAEEVQQKTALHRLRASLPVEILEPEADAARQCEQAQQATQAAEAALQRHEATTPGAAAVPAWAARRAELRDQVDGHRKVLEAATDTHRQARQRVAAALRDELVQRHHTAMEAWHGARQKAADETQRLEAELAAAKARHQDTIRAAGARVRELRLLAQTTGMNISNLMSEEEYHQASITRRPLGWFT